MKIQIISKDASQNPSFKDVLLMSMFYSLMRVSWPSMVSKIQGNFHSQLIYTLLFGLEDYDFAPQNFSPTLKNFSLSRSSVTGVLSLQFKFSDLGSLLIISSWGVIHSSSKYLSKVELAFLFLFVHVLFNWFQKGKIVEATFSSHHKTGFLKLQVFVEFWTETAWYDWQKKHGNMSLQSQILDSA